MEEMYLIKSAPAFDPERSFESLLPKEVVEKLYADGHLIPLDDPRRPIPLETPNMCAECTLEKSRNTGEPIIWVARFEDRSAVYVFCNELDALRFANGESMRVYPVPSGKDAASYVPKGREKTP